VTRLPCSRLQPGSEIPAPCSSRAAEQRGIGRIATRSLTPAAAGRSWPQRAHPAPARPRGQERPELLSSRPAAVRARAGWSFPSAKISKRPPAGSTRARAAHRFQSQEKPGPLLSAITADEVRSSMPTCRPSGATSCLGRWHGSRASMRHRALHHRTNARHWRCPGASRCMCCGIVAAMNRVVA